MICRLLAGAFALLMAAEALAGPIAATIRVPQDEPDLQTAINQVQGLFAAAVIVDDTVSYTGPILITDSVIITAAEGAEPVVVAGGIQGAIRIIVPTVLFRPAVNVQISGIDLVAPDLPPGPGRGLIDIVHNTGKTDLWVSVEDADLVADRGLSRSCLSVFGAANAALVDVTMENIKCQVAARDGNNVFAIQYESPRGSLRVAGDSLIRVDSFDTASTAIAVAVNNTNSGQPVATVLENINVQVRGFWLAANGLLTRGVGTDVDVVDSTFLFGTTNNSGAPRSGVALPVFAVWAEDGSQVDALSTRFVSQGDLATDMQLLATDVSGATIPVELGLRNCLIDNGYVRVVAGNSGGPLTATNAVLVNNTIYSPTRPAIILQTSMPSIGNLDLFAYSNALIADTGIELIGPETGLTGQWDHNLYDITTASTVGITPGPDAVVADARVIDAAAGLFTPRLGSPLIDAGDTTIANGLLPPLDLAGNDRYSGDEIDIGALEFSEEPIFSDSFE